MSKRKINQKFWKWIKEKGYDNSNYENVKYGYPVYEDMPKQMLIGYMFEYIKSNRVHDGTIDDLFEDLKKEIEELSKQ